jgi:enamine deaminase RidA (YjgF/YER057c/UK114 family)
MMTDSIEARLASLGVELPAASAPAANYLPYLRHGDLLFVSGQLPMTGKGIEQRGQLGGAVSLEDGQKAARLCAINILAQAKAALSGDLERLRQIVRITGFVASKPDFTDQHLVVNGASDFFAEALGDRGKHSRAAVGVAALPLGAAVEVDAVIAVA